MRLPAELRPQDVTAIQDTREQWPVSLSPLNVVVGTLKTADYSVRGLEHFVAIERKSEEDMLTCIGRERDRFDREIQRLLAYPVRAIVVESLWTAFELGQWRGAVTTEQAVGSLLGWVAVGVPIIMAGDHDRAGRYIARLLYTAARRRWRECRTLAAGIMEEEPAA
jgi:ERCC4-type nuclease